MKTGRREVLGQIILGALPLGACGHRNEPVRCAAGPSGAVCADDTGKHLSLQGTVVRSVARKFGLRHDESCIFKDGYTLYDRVVNLSRTPKRKGALERFHAIGQRSIDGAMGQVKSAIAGSPSSEMGARHIRRLPQKGGRYVIFSDHHYTFSGHRTNFFAEAGNMGVYADALDAYREEGFTVIENGDVEDLVIFDPTWSPGEVALRKCMGLEQLKERRLEVRLEQLQRILGDRANAPLIEAYQRLDAEKKLIRVAGNHDYDNQRPEFLALLRQYYPNLTTPSDIVLLDRDDGSAAFAIMHGHQFDVATNPKSGPRFGETISETLGLYYQGPDRTWRWVDDDVHHWASGKQPFLDNLALGQATLHAERIHRHEGKKDPLNYDLDVNPTGAHASIRALLAEEEGAAFEAVFKQTIAWHYFKNSDPMAAFDEEVMTGDRFFKYQLLDEVWLKRQILKTFPDERTRPTLVLGHTHEVRLNPLDPTDSEHFPWYLNSGSAGRFENLIWGIEIDDGKATLVSFSRANPPLGKVERREWKSSKKERNGWARAAESSSPVPSYVASVTAPRVEAESEGLAPVGEPEAPLSPM